MMGELKAKGAYQNGGIKTESSKESVICGCGIIIN